MPQKTVRRIGTLFASILLQRYTVTPSVRARQSPTNTPQGYSTFTNSAKGKKTKFSGQITHGGMGMIKKEIVVNGIPRRLVVNGEDTLATVLRANLGLTGTKVGCGEGQCGACSVLVDGKVIRSCATKMKRRRRRRQDHHHRGHRHPGQPASPAAGLDGPRRRPVRLLHPGLYRLGQSPARQQSQAHPRRGPRLVPETPQRLPLHRLQAAGGCGHGCRQGAARRDEHR